MVITMNISTKTMQAFWTDGVSVWSYDTCIATPDDNAINTYIFNETKYSVTTSKHQNRLKAEYGRLNVTIKTVNGLNRGADRDTLLAASR
jgi:hypothetical protein